MSASLACLLLIDPARRRRLEAETTVRATHGSSYQRPAIEECDQDSGVQKYGTTGGRGHNDLVHGAAVAWLVLHDAGDAIQGLSLGSRATACSRLRRHSSASEIPCRRAIFLALAYRLASTEICVRIMLSLYHMMITFGKVRDQRSIHCVGSAAA